MRALNIFTLLALFIAGYNSTVTFTSPVAGDVWTVGQTQDISWTKVNATDNPNGDYLSVRLYQVFPNDTTTPNFEYLIRNAVPDTVTVNPQGWTVYLDPSDLNSQVSNKYVLALYLETTTGILAQSDDFTIKNTTAVSSTTSTSSSSSSSSTTAATTTTTSSATTKGAASTTTTTAAGSSGLGTGAKAGIGIGVSAAVLIGLGLGWFLFGRNRSQNNVEGPATPMQPYAYASPKPPVWGSPTPGMSEYNAVPQNVVHEAYAPPNPHVAPVTYAELPGQR